MGVALLTCLVGTVALAGPVAASPVGDDGAIAGGGQACAPTVPADETSAATALETSDRTDQPDGDASEENATDQFFVVAVDAPLRAEAGEVVEVTAIVENVGDEAGEQSVGLAVGGEVVEETAVELVPRETTTLSFTYETALDDVCDLEVAIESEDTSAERIVEVVEPVTPASVAIDVESAPDAVVSGETLTVEAGVENTGDEATVQDVALELDGEERDVEEVALEGGETQTVTLAVDVGEADLGDREVVVTSANDSAATTVTVEEDDSFFDVTLSERPDAVQATQVIEVDATVENTGHQADDQIVVFEADGSAWDAQPTELEPGEATTLQFEYETDADEVGEEVSVGVRSYDDRDDDAVAVEEPEPVFDVSVSAPEFAEAGETITVDATVENVGVPADDQIVVFAQDGSEWDAVPVELDGGESTTLTFEYESDEGDVGELPVSVRSYDDSDEATVTVDVAEVEASAGPTADSLDASRSQSVAA